MCDTTKKDKVMPIHFYKVALCGTSSTAEHNTVSSTVVSVQKGKKRRLSSEEDQSSAPLSKRQSLSALSAEDLDLLNSYWVDTDMWHLCNAFLCEEHDTEMLLVWVFTIKK